MTSKELIEALVKKGWCVFEYSGCIGSFIEERNLEVSDLEIPLNIEPGFRVEKHPDTGNTFVYWPDKKYKIYWTPDLENKIRKLFPDCKIFTINSDRQYVIYTGVYK